MFTDHCLAGMLEMAYMKTLYMISKFIAALIYRVCVEYHKYLTKIVFTENMDIMNNVCWLNGSQKWTVFKNSKLRREIRQFKSTRVGVTSLSEFGNGTVKMAHGRSCD